MTSDRPGAPKLAAGLLTLLLPSPCVACDRPIGYWRPQLGLCVHCRGRLHQARRQCAQCGVPIASRRLPPGFRCGACRLNPPAFDRLHAPYLYLPPLDSVVRHLKFGGLPYLGRHAARLMSQVSTDELRRAEVVVPVPLHWRRQLSRGYNQAREIARPLARLLERRHSAALQRIRATSPQTDLSRLERQIGPAGAFGIRRGSDVGGRHVLLVDDVITTGATLNAAAAVLKQSGAAAVTVAVLGRTPAPGVHPDGAWQDS